MNIVIADDNEIAIEVLRCTLAEAGHEVRCVTNGREALDVVREGWCRLVISDWDMPEMNGLELCREIRGCDVAGYVYIVLLTAHNRVEEKVTGLAAGADDFIAKPFDPAEMLARVRTAERVLSMETREVAIFAMAKLAESRDPETGAHLERVRSYSRALGQALAKMHLYPDIINAEYIRLLYQTSPLHDIGKVGIPDSVLLKPGRLSDREFQIMKMHTTIGAETLDAALKQFPGIPFLEMASDIARSHHERIDGTGYPNQLVGDAIPLCARIVTLADVYDALTSKRVYKDAFGHDVARGIILGEGNAQFDATIIAAFEECESIFISIRARYAESSRAAA